MYWCSSAVGSAVNKYKCSNRNFNLPKKNSSKKIRIKEKLMDLWVNSEAYNDLQTWTWGQSWEWWFDSSHMLKCPLGRHCPRWSCTGYHKPLSRRQPGSGELSWLGLCSAASYRDTTDKHLLDGAPVGCREEFCSLILFSLAVIFWTQSLFHIQDQVFQAAPPPCCRPHQVVVPDKAHHNVAWGEARDPSLRRVCSAQTHIRKQRTARGAEARRS